MPRVELESPPRSMLDAKEFSVEPKDNLQGSIGQCTTCTGPKCAGPCVQKCLPPPPPPCKSCR